MDDLTREVLESLRLEVRDVDVFSDDLSFLMAELYECSPQHMRKDTEQRLQGRPAVFRLRSNVKNDLDELNRRFQEVKRICQRYFDCSTRKFSEWVQANAALVDNQKRALTNFIESL